MVLEFDRLLLDAVAEEAELRSAMRDRLLIAEGRAISSRMADEGGGGGCGAIGELTFLCWAGVMGCRLWKRSLLSVSLGSWAQGMVG